MYPVKNNHVIQNAPVYMLPIDNPNVNHILPCDNENVMFYATNENDMFYATNVGIYSSCLVPNTCFMYPVKNDPVIQNAPDYVLPYENVMHPIDNPNVRHIPPCDNEKVMFIATNENIRYNVTDVESSDGIPPGVPHQKNEVTTLDRLSGHQIYFTLHNRQIPR